MWSRACQCPDVGCLRFLVYMSLTGSMIEMTSSCVAQKVRSRLPLSFMFPSPYLPITTFQATWSLSWLALISPSIASFFRSRILQHCRYLLFCVCSWRSGGIGAEEVDWPPAVSHLQLWNSFIDLNYQGATVQVYGVPCGESLSVLPMNFRIRIFESPRRMFAFRLCYYIKADVSL